MSATTALPTGSRYRAPPCSGSTLRFARNDGRWRQGPSSRLGATSKHVLAREYYKALMSARKLVEYEEKITHVASGV